ncbi:TPA: hypothetical protein ACH3X1_007450 [Trebouxia sp. C0004]
MLTTYQVALPVLWQGVAQLQIPQGDPAGSTCGISSRFCLTGQDFSSGLEQDRKPRRCWCANDIEPIKSTLVHN